MEGLRIAQLIDLTEIKVTRDQDLNAVALILGDGRRNADRAFERFGGYSL